MCNQVLGFFLLHLRCFYWLVSSAGMPTICAALSRVDE
jgi:hypothetical protein